MAATTYTFGTGGNAILTTAGGAVTVCVKEWSCNLDLGTQVLTTTCSDGWQDLGTGVKSVEVTFSGFYDPTDNTLANLANADVLPIEFRLGNSLATVIGDFLVKSFKITNPATEYITFECSVGSSGPVTFTD